ncbi:DUF6087 family protein [Streptomyces barkulensis]|uniref:DUF6087 family protein n=1 Tax=Streptomyces barkulensis TaxID=1257026 RepID=UPI000C6CB14B|nr:DUF6087 family protein [Streptomyces barkulensis]
MPDEEPLSDYMARREARIGRMRIVHAYGPRRGEHVGPGQPRLVERWNRSSWEFFAMADNLIHARRIVRPPTEQVSRGETPEPPANPLAPGRGRHRKPR